MSFPPAKHTKFEEWIALQVQLCAGDRWPSMSCHCKALEGSLVPKMQSSLQKHLRVSVGPRRVMGSDVPDARDRFIRLLAGP